MDAEESGAVGDSRNGWKSRNEKPHGDVGQWEGSNQPERSRRGVCMRVQGEENPKEI